MKLACRLLVALTLLGMAPPLGCHQSFGRSGQPSKKSAKDSLFGHCSDGNVWVEHLWSEGMSAFDADSLLCEPGDATGIQSTTRMSFVGFPKRSVRTISILGYKRGGNIAYYLRARYRSPVPGEESQSKEIYRELSPAEVALSEKCTFHPVLNSTLKSVPWGLEGSAIGWFRDDGKTVHSVGAYCPTWHSTPRRAGEEVMPPEVIAALFECQQILCDLVNEPSLCSLNPKTDLGCFFW